MQQYPLVSIVLTSYNQQEQLKVALQSLLKQTYNNIEIIIVDDASTDGLSQPYICSQAKLHPLKVRYFFHGQNVGIVRNKNTGFKLARGRYITYLDGDDYYLPEKIEREVEIFLTDPLMDVVYTNFRLEDVNGHVQTLWNEGEEVPEGFVFEQVITRGFPHNMLYRCELMKAEVLKKIDYYDETITAYHDWDSRIRYSKFCKLKYINYVGSVYVQDPAGISKTTKQLRLTREMEQVFEKNKPLLADLPAVQRRRIKKAVAEMLLQRLLIHSSSLGTFAKSVYHYLLLNPSDVKFILRQVYGRAKRLLIR